MPRVLNRYRNVITDGSVYIGRPSCYGNPFVMGIDGSRDEVIEKYKEWIVTQPGLIKKIKIELKGKDLVCFCHPHKCHGDIILDIANKE